MSAPFTPASFSVTFLGAQPTLFQRATGLREKLIWPPPTKISGSISGVATVSGHLFDDVEPKRFVKRFEHTPAPNVLLRL